MRSPTLLTLAASLVSSASLAQEIKPQYSSLRDCKAVKSLTLPDRVLKDGVFRCAGAGDYVVYVVEDDPRSFLVLAHRGILWVNTKANMEEALDNRGLFEV